MSFTLHTSLICPIFDRVKEQKLLNGMDVNLSSDNVSGLKRLGNATLLNEDVFSKLIDAGISTLTDTPCAIDVKALCSSKGDLVKEAYSAFLTLLVEATCTSLSAEVLQQGLATSHGWSVSRAEHLSKVYKINQCKLTAALSNVGSQPLHITDVQWRLDYCIQTSTANSLSTPLFFIKLVSEEDNNYEASSIKFVCTQHELQDLVSKLKDALRHVEKIAATSST